MSVAAGELGHDLSADAHVSKEVKDRQWRMVVIGLLISDIVFVLGLFFAYLYLRALNVNNMWKPASVHAPSYALSLLVVGLVVASAAAFRYGDLGIRRGSVPRLRSGVALALIFWIAELVAACYQLATVSFPPSAGAFASSFYALAGYHVFHLVLGLLLGLGLLNRVVHGRYNEQNYTQVQVVGYFWYWVMLMALAMVILPK